ncbi:hypothetical protein HYV31_03555 [candidate division WWE3 bacterium]|nr:hypothetical protein [candidate division WWE3 bacterium]
MKTTHFQYPWNGPVYSFEARDAQLLDGVNVILPDGNTEVRVTVLEDHFPTVGKPVELQINQPHAKVVIPENGFQVKFDGKWKSIAKLVNAAAAVNTLFSVILTHEEYYRLNLGGLDQIKYLFSERAFSLLYLYDDYRTDGPSLELFRTGTCR